MLEEYFEDIDNNNDKDIIKFLLCLNKNINNISYLFDECKSLISVEYYQISKQSNEVNDKSQIISNLNDSINISSDSELFSFTLSNISTENENFKISFSLSNSLILLPNISKLDISNINNMSRMFCGCESLISF